MTSCNPQQPMGQPQGSRPGGSSATTSTPVATQTRHKLIRSTPFMKWKWTPIVTWVKGSIRADLGERRGGGGRQRSAGRLARIPGARPARGGGAARTPWRPPAAATRARPLVEGGLVWLVRRTERWSGRGKAKAGCGLYTARSRHLPRRILRSSRPAGFVLGRARHLLRVPGSGPTRSGTVRPGLVRCHGPRQVANKWLNPPGIANRDFDLDAWIADLRGIRSGVWW
jgi:hypothetical protein